MGFAARPCDHAQPAFTLDTTAMNSGAESGEFTFAVVAELVGWILTIAAAACEVPDHWVVVGALIIVASGIFVVRVSRQTGPQSGPG